MKKMTLLKVFVVLVLCAVALGFYRGWFVLSSHGSGDGEHKVDVNLTVDPGKAREDAEKLEKKAKDLTGNKTDKTPHDTTEDGLNSKTK